MDANRQRGFTLWELLMTMLVAGILIGVGVPNVMEFQRNGQMTAAANDLVTGALMARTEAVKRQAPVVLCLTNDATLATPVCSPNAVANSATRGFIVFVDDNDNFDATGARILTDATDGNAVVNADEQILMRSVARGGTILLSANCGHVSYAPTGFPRQVAALCAPANRRFVYCDDRGRRASAGQLSSARALTIDRMGRGQVYQEIADVNSAITATAATCP